MRKPRGTPPLEDLSTFGISPARGFLPEPDPAAALPDEFAPWEGVAGNLPKLLLAGRLRAAVDGLPVLSLEPVTHEPHLRRAMVLLSYLGHAYVWGDMPPADRIPAPLAIPWHALSGRLGRPPVLSYASYALDNWRRFDADRAIELGNIAIRQNFLGGADEDWFIAVHIHIEAKAAPILLAIGPALRAVAQRDAAALRGQLETVASTLEVLVHALQRMPEHCDPYIYYRRVRPYIHGWKDNPALPNGLRYEGVDGGGGPTLRLRGETGAQSGIVPALDALLGLVHADDPLRQYLAEMRDYMPPGHRRFLERIETSEPLRPFVGEAARAVKSAYNACLHWLGRFRTVHLEFAASYIHRQAGSQPGNPTAIGTGGTPFMEYLRKHRDETRAHRL